MNRIDENNVAFKVDAYKVDKTTFEQAKAEVIKGLRRDIANVEVLTEEQFAEAKKRGFL